MRIKVLRCPDKQFKPYVHRAASFFGESLIPNKNLSKNVDLKVIFDSTIKDYGYAEIAGVNASNKPREFTITIHPFIGAKYILETLAHEMVHVKQFVNGETDESLSRWFKYKVDSDKVDYWILPWEIEAYGRESGLITKFAIKEKLWDVFEDFKNPDDAIEYCEIKWKKVPEMA